MGYIEDDTMVRVDFFKPSGKWYTTEGVRWRTIKDGLLFEEFALSLQKHLKDRLSEMTAVCLEPYHKYNYPIMLQNGAWLHYIVEKEKVV